MSVVPLDLGEGWIPAVLNSEDEWGFIRKGQAGKGELYSFWIGGSSDANIIAGDIISYYQYMTAGSGNPHHL